MAPARPKGTAMSPEQFMSELDQLVKSSLERIGSASAAGEPGPSISIPRLLSVALKNELEACEEAAIWLASEPDVEVKLALARQCGDEAKHFRLIQERLLALGAEPALLSPPGGGYSPMFAFLKDL